MKKATLHTAGANVGWKLLSESKSNPFRLPKWSETIPGLICHHGYFDFWWRRDVRAPSRGEHRVAIDASCAASQRSQGRSGCRWLRGKRGSVPVQRHQQPPERSSSTATSAARGPHWSQDLGASCGCSNVSRLHGSLSVFSCRCLPCLRCLISHHSSGETFYHRISVVNSKLEIYFILSI
ncbi:MAG: hypothetical protein HHAS10_00470 [Candidatus Altimarinota bacterium]